MRPNADAPNPGQLALFADPRPPLPPSRWSDTSRAAAHAIREAAPAQRARVLAFVEARGALGATIEEIATGLQIRESSACGRVAELARPVSGSALIRDSGRRRATSSGCAAKVWEAC